MPMPTIAHEMMTCNAWQLRSSSAEKTKQISLSLQHYLRNAKYYVVRSTSLVVAFPVLSYARRYLVVAVEIYEVVVIVIGFFPA
mmetsp:Transcript_17940/g.41171  ORF Transcript_17940/g.41171 Transcript_17940/m.41171 type:complete len:84 (+) Transcript_17940:993-1244(+)